MNFSVISENLGFFAKGFIKTGELTIIAMIAGIVLGIVFGAARLARNHLISYPAATVVEVIRGTPILMLIFWVFFLLPRVTGRPVEASIAGLLSLVAFNAAYSAEIIRAGIQAVPVGQVEAGKATGLSWWNIFHNIILPQAISNMMPALISQGIMLYKTTSLVYIIGVIEFFRAAAIVNNREFCPYEIYIFVGLVYLIPSTIGSYISRSLESRRARKKAL